MDVWAVIRYARVGRDRDLVAIFRTFEMAKTYIQTSEEADERDYNIEQHTLDHPEVNAP